MLDQLPGSLQKPVIKSTTIYSMPEKIKLEDGTEREVPTQAELDALKAKAEDATAVETRVRTEMEANMEPNWKAVRPLLDKSKKVTQQLKEKGFEIDEQGNIVTAKEGGASNSAAPVDVAAITKAATDAGAQAATNVLLGEKKQTFMKQYPKETQDVIEVYFKKLAAGETLTAENQQLYLEKATQLALPGSTQVQKRGVRTANGGAPVFEKKSESHADTEDGKAAANWLFGDESFAKPPAK